MRSLFAAGLMSLCLVSLGLVSLGLAASNAFACERQADYVCDEPYIGTGLCPLNSDTQDCASANVWYGSDEQPVDPAAVFELPPDYLRLARNEIFARHGYLFQSADLDAFFSARSWYEPRDAAIDLSALEAANVAVFKSEEEAQKEALPDASGMPRPRVSFTGTAVFDDGTRHSVEHIDGNERQKQSGGPSESENERLIYSDVREIWTLQPEIDIVTVYSIWHEPGVLVRLPALLAQLHPILEGEDTVGGERALRFRLDWTDEFDEQRWQGLVWVTPDGIVLKGEVDFRTYDGDYLYEQGLRFELQDLQREAVDPARLERPSDLDVNFAG